MPEESAVQAARDFIKRIRTDPGFFARRILGIKLWRKQALLLKLLAEGERVVARSGHGVGKTTAAGVAALWFLNAFAPSKVVTTAPTRTQVESILWAEIRRLYHNAQISLGGDLYKKSLRYEDDWFAIGLSTNRVENFQGFHSENILVIFDEAPGIDYAIWEAAEGLLTSSVSKFLAIGNPRSPSGKFYDAFRDETWKKIHISCYDCPNVVGHKALIPGLVTFDWVKKKEIEWGKGSPLFISKVLGQFPSESENVLIPLSWLERSTEQEIPEISPEDLKLGVDVARFGGDKTVLTLRDGFGIRKIWDFERLDTMEVAGKTKWVMNEFEVPPERVYVDDIGVGGGVVDRLRELDLNVNSVNLSSTAEESEQYENLRAEVYWKLRLSLDPTRCASIFHIPAQYSRLHHELSVPEYSLSSKGKIRIESKEKVKSKLSGKSPDYSDSLVLSFVGEEIGRRSQPILLASEAAYSSEEAGQRASGQEVEEKRIVQVSRRRGFGFRRRVQMFPRNRARIFER